MAKKSSQIRSGLLFKRFHSAWVLVAEVAVLLVAAALTMTFRNSSGSNAATSQASVPPSIWRLGFVNSDVLSAASFPFSYYTHVVVLGLNCSSKGALYDQWGYNAGNWSAYRSGATSKGVKLMLFIGGDMTSCTTSNNLASYVSKIVDTVNGKDVSLNPGQIIFDGLDLDWEGGMSDSMTLRYEHLISALRNALGPTKLISIDGWAASYFKTVVVNQQGQIDRFNNEMYDSAVNGSSNNLGQKWSWYNMANRNVDSGNYSGNVEGGFTQYIAAGFPASKINVGIPLYGYLYTGCTHARVVGCSASRTQYRYNQIRNNSVWWNSPHLNDFRNGADYISLPASNQYLTYTGAEQIAELTRWGKSVSLGGYFTWEVDFEELSAGREAQNFPLSFALFSNTVNILPTSIRSHPR